MEKLLEGFGAKVFSESVMKEKLPSPVYKKWKETLSKRDALDRTTADAIAHAMKEWALAQGCTHYTHWFQPLNGTTAEKHDAFLDKSNDEPILKFSGKNLIKGEPDASSFPSGGLRATFEARGYTYWDCTSPVFIKDNILCIPTVFVSFKGEALDAKEPLIRSCEVISKAAVRLCNAFGDKDVSEVKPVIGLEQEYFLVDKDKFLKREDLLFTGKTLFGALPPKGQELETHYFGTIPERVHAFMKEVNERLWELGIYAKNEHNEVAPAQFELAPIFSEANVAIDQNHLIMEILQTTALKHNLVCLLHEKPYQGVNGSGKHNNWSLVTNTGVNLLDPGKNPHENVQFLVVMCAVIKAVDTYPELIRLFSSCPGNDYRLGANEAPPAIISIFLGEVIEKVLEQLEDNKPTTYEKNSLKEFGISTLSYLPKDNSDRNRTSPVAFTGNKFEFRSLGSSMSASKLNVTINTIVAETLNEICDTLEAHKYRQDVRKAALDICVDIIKKHRRILFSGDGYSSYWVEEATKRGLPNIKTFVESIKYMEEKKSYEVFMKMGVYTKEEFFARVDIMYENYYKIKSIEIKTMIDMAMNKIIPLANKNIALYASSAPYTPHSITKRIENIVAYIDSTYSSIQELKNILTASASFETYKEKGFYLLNHAYPFLDKMRKEYDDIEEVFDYSLMTYPKYDELLYSIDY